MIINYLQILDWCLNFDIRAGKHGQFLNYQNDLKLITNQFLVLLVANSAVQD